MLAVALGGAAGALSRYAFHDTMLVNALGCLALALLLALADAPALRRHPALRVGVTVGFLGAFTTFSTLCGEIARLLLDGRTQAALESAALSLALGVVAVTAGHVVGRRIAHAKGWDQPLQGPRGPQAPAAPQPPPGVGGPA